MWWIYFHYGQGEAAEKAQATSKPEAVAHNLFTYGHLPIVAGIILTAVGEEFALSHASEDASFEHASAILGGPALFLAGNVWVKLAAASRLPISHLAGLVLLAATAAAVPFATNAFIAISATASLIVAALWEYVALQRRSPVAA
jgi:low temperature requirement protein LtrA